MKLRVTTESDRRKNVYIYIYRKIVKKKKLEKRINILTNMIFYDGIDLFDTKIL